MIVHWGTSGLALHIDAGDGGPRLAGLGRFDAPGPDSPVSGTATDLPLVQIEVVGEGRSGTSGKRHVDGALSNRLRYLTHTETTHGDWRHLQIRMQDPLTELHVTAHYEAHVTRPTVRSWCELTAGKDVVLEHVSSFVLGGAGRALGSARWDRDLTLWTAANPWSAELRWSGSSLPEHGLYDSGMTRFGQTGSKNRVSLTSAGSWPSSEYLPMGWLSGPGGVLAWQIEHNGSWHAELGERYDDVYLSLSGPSQREHQWSQRLASGESFTSVPVTIAFGADQDEVLDALTGYRRASRRPHPDHEHLPIVFNDFMNSLMGEPTTERLLPLVAAAGEAGAEYFCIDAGWFDEELDRAPGPGGVPGWWDGVGAWEVSAKRFPGGLGEVMDAIRAVGMRPGLWLEPEVVGVNSPVAERLPEEAFFRRDGLRVVEWGRYQLDLRHPAAIAHLDESVDRLIDEFGLGYLKFDYNIDIGVGTQAGDESAGAGLLGHNRAYLSWLDALLDRHPGLVVEGCAAGGMRLDQATLSRVPIQSVTDQQDDRLIAAIAVAAPTVVPPEQGAIWAYPQGDFDADRIAFTMISAMLGRVHLSGRPDQLDAEQMALVQQALTVYKGYRQELATAVPRWPLGLPRWDSGWLALALRCGADTLLGVWRRDSPVTTLDLDLPWVGTAQATVLYPPGAGQPVWDGSSLSVELPRPGTAVLIRLAAS